MFVASNVQEADQLISFRGSRLIVVSGGVIHRSCVANYILPLCVCVIVEACIYVATYIFTIKKMCHCVFDYVCIYMTFQQPYI